jgi:hypothetical protein
MLSPCRALLGRTAKLGRCPQRRDKAVSVGIAERFLRAVGDRGLAQHLEQDHSGSRDAAAKRRGQQGPAPAIWHQQGGSGEATQQGHQDNGGSHGGLSQR